VEELD
jgi:hypothetical protein